MRDGLDAPTFELPREDVAAIRAFLDGQSRILCAMWVRHRQPGAGGWIFDHHLMLGVDADDWSTGDMVALEHGMQLPGFDTREPTWIDLYPVTEVEGLRSFGVVVWEQSTPGPDPLDYRFTAEPFKPDPAATQEFVARIHGALAIRRAATTMHKLWKGEEVVRETVLLTVDAPPDADAVQVASEAAGDTIFAGFPYHSTTVGPPSVEGTVVYERGS